MSGWNDAWGFESRTDTEPLIQGGVGEIGAVLRVDVKKVVAVHARPFDPSVSDEVDVFMSTVPYMSFPTDTPASTRFLDILRRGYDFEASLFAAGEIGARSLPSLGKGIIDNSDNKQDVFQTYNWGGRSWRVFVGEQDQQFASFTEVWPGKAGRDAELGRDVIEIPLEDVARRFDQPVQQAVFTPGFEPYVEFDGTNDEIAFGDNLDRGSTGFHIGVAFRTTAALQNAGLYGKEQDSGASAGYGIGLASGGPIRFSLADGIDQIVNTHTPTGGYNTGERIAVVARVNRSTNLSTMFVKIGSGAWAQVDQDDITAVGSVNNAVQLFAARRGGGDFFSGEIERMAMRSGGADSITASFQAVFDERFADDVDASALDHYVPLTENVGTSAGDASPSGFDGTIGGGVTAKWSGLQSGRRELDGERIPLSYGDLRGDLLNPTASNPLNILRRMRVEPVLIDEIKQVYKWHDGSSESLDSAEQGGLEITAETVSGDFWTNDDGPTAGSYWIDLTNSLIRLGTEPDRKLTLALRGDNSPGFIDEPHRILRRIAGTKVGIAEPAGFEDAAFIDLDGQPPVGIYIRDERIDATFDWLMRSVQGWWAVGRTGLVTVGQMAVPSLPEATIADDVIAAESRRRSSVPAVHWRDRVEYGRNWAPQAQGELAPIADRKSVV